MIWSVSRYSFQSESQVAAPPHHLPQTKGAKCLVGLFGSNLNHIRISCFYPSIIKSLIRIPASSGDQNKKRQADFPLGPHDPAEPMILKVSVVNRHAVWSLWKATKGESYCRALRFKRKSMPSFTDKHFPFEKQLLVCY